MPEGPVHKPTFTDARGTSSQAYVYRCQRDQFTSLRLQMPEGPVHKPTFTDAWGTGDSRPGLCRELYRNPPRWSIQCSLEPWPGCCAPHSVLLQMWALQWCDRDWITGVHKWMYGSVQIISQALSMIEYIVCYSNKKSYRRRLDIGSIREENCCRHIARIKWSGRSRVCVCCIRLWFGIWQLKLTLTNHCLHRCNKKFWT